jgi:hypothetical protein
MAVPKLEAASKLFAGQGDLVIFDEILDYTGKSLANLTVTSGASGSCGQIVQDSTNWEGEDVNTEQILDEQGNLITARVTAGTLGFSFDIASTSLGMVKRFLAGEDIEGSALASLFDGTVSAVGFGTKLPVMTRPIAVVNDELNRAWIYPKAKITSNLAYSDGLYRIHAVVLAENLDVRDPEDSTKQLLATGMIVEKVA